MAFLKKMFGFYYLMPLVAAFAFVLSLPGYGEVSKSPPEVYEREIQPLLTPLKDLMETKDVHAGKDEPGAARLSEVITRVNEDGSYLRAVHSVLQPYTRKAAEESATRRFRFQSHLETVHVALARTVLPDGTEKLLAPNAIFLQKGERGSGSVYDDGQDLVLVFPDVKPGVFCEVVIVYERSKPAVAGGHSEFVDWTAGWPIGIKRRVIDLPADWEKRLTVKSLGNATATATAMEAPAGRWRRSWRAESINSSWSEISEAPEMQTGPGTWLTTFRSWDEVAAWYAGLLADRGELGTELKAKVDEWTKDDKSPQAILRTLHDHVANEIRYEGLEFGLSGLQPYPCEVVWKNQYGDCKDKANLLVAMLRHKGIKANVALVNTEHAGLIAKEIPDYLHFNHAIAVVELPGANSEPVFCDATISGGSPGLLSPSSGDRDILVINGTQAQWVRTPPAPAGKDTYTFELEMNPEGRISGWVSWKATGYNAVFLSERFDGADRESNQSWLQSFVSDFIAGAEVVDFILPDKNTPASEPELKVYFTCPTRQMNDDGRISLPFPWAARLLNNYGDGSSRRTSYFQWVDHIVVESKIRLPDGWQADSLPQPMHLDTPPFQGTATWTYTGSVCEAKLDLNFRQAVIPADQVAAPAQANRALRSWLEVPLMLKRNSDPAIKESKPLVRADMPLMPTGNGQMNLVDRWFPSTGDRQLRKSALDQTVRYFPNDPETVFHAKTELADLLRESNKLQEAQAAFVSLLQQRPDGVGIEYYAYARFLHALNLEELGKPDEAISICRSLAEDESISNFRRGRSAWAAGFWLAQKPPVLPEATSLLLLATTLDDSSRELALPLVIPTMIATGEGDALVKSIASGTLFDGLKDGGASALKQMTQGIASGETVIAGAADVIPWLIKAKDSLEPGPTADAISSTIGTLENWAKQGETLAGIRTGVLTWIENHRPDDFKDPAIERITSGTEAEELIVEMDGKGDKALLGLSAGYFRKFEATKGFPTVLWKYLAWVKGTEAFQKIPADKSAMPELFALSDRLPQESDPYLECLFVKAAWLNDHGRLDEEIAVYRQLLEIPDLAERGYNLAAWSRMAAVYESQGKWSEAVASYLEVKEERREYRLANECILRAGFLLARDGKRAEALDQWALLSDSPPSAYASSALSEDIAEAILLAKDREATLQQWERSEEWWRKNFVPYFASLKVGMITRPKIILSDQLEALNLRCRDALTRKELKPISEELASIAYTSRFLPSHLIPLRTLMEQYARPLALSTRPQELECFRAATALVKVSTRDMVDLCLRYDAGISADLGRPGHALEILAGQWEEAPNRSDDHRERSAWIFGMAAEQSKKELETALALSSQWVEKAPQSLNITQWALLHANLLVASQRTDEAITFLTSIKEKPDVKNDQSLLVPLAERLAQLQGQSDRTGGILAAATEFLKKHKPSWYDHVGPTDLSDPRVGNPGRILDGNPPGFHSAELFRLRMLIALDSETEVALREEALGQAMGDVFGWQTTFDESLNVASEVIENSALSLEFRLKLMWRIAVELAAHGQTASLAKLRKGPTYAQYSDVYKKEYYPFLTKLCEGIASGPEEIKAALEFLNQGEVDSMELSMAAMGHEAFLGNGDLEGAAWAREQLKKWKLSPSISAEGNSARLAWLRTATSSKGAIEFHKRMLAHFRPRFEAMAQNAPSNWQSRTSIRARDLGEKERNAIFAARALSGERLNAADSSEWFLSKDAWLQQEATSHVNDVTTVLSLLDHLDADFSVSLATLQLLLTLEAPPNGKWTEIDELLKSFKESSYPATNAFVGFWQQYRDYQMGQSLDIPRMQNFIPKAGWLSEPMTWCIAELAYANGDMKALGRILDAAKPEDLTSSYSLPIYLLFLQELDRKEEYELASEGVERLIQEAVMESWVERSVSDFTTACVAAVLCNRQDLLPAPWLEEVPGTFGSAEDRSIARGYAAFVKQDWKRVKEIMDEMPKDQRNDEHSWLTICALDGLGKPDEALALARKVVAGGNRDSVRFLECARYIRHTEAKQ
jgi:tetratricopeptide (TPR) repeat protein/transglutaminase-like putative cysteine protease